MCYCHSAKSSGLSASCIFRLLNKSPVGTITVQYRFKQNASWVTGVARNFKMKPAIKISEISAEAQHFLQDWVYTHSKKEALSFVIRKLGCSANQRKAMILISLRIYAG